MNLGFNQGRNWLVMMSGDAHMTTFDSGEFNLFGGLQCKNPGWSGPVHIRRGQFCKFDIYENNNGRKCLRF